MIEVVKLKNGVRVILEPMPYLHSVAVGVWVFVGCVVGWVGDGVEWRRLWWGAVVVAVVWHVGCHLVVSLVEGGLGVLQWG